MSESSGNFRAQGVVMIVFIALFIGNLQISVLFPILPGLVHQLDDVVNRTTERRFLIIGTIIGVGNLVEVLVMPLVVAILAVVGQKWTLTLSSVLEALGCFVIACVPQLWALYSGRILQCTGAIIMDIVTCSLLAEWFQNAKRSRALAFVFHAIPLSYITSYLFGTWVYHLLGYHVLLTCIGILTLCVIPLWFCLLMKDDDLEPLQVPERRGQDHNLILCLLSNALIWAATSLMDSTLPNDFHARFNAEIWQIGLIMAVSVVAQILAQVLVGETSSKLWLWTYSGVYVGGCGLLIYPGLPSLWYAVITECLVRMGHGIVNTATGCMVAEYVDFHSKDQDSNRSLKYSRIYGFHSLSKVGGLAVGAFVGGIVLNFAPISILYWTAGGFMCMCGTVIVLMVACKLNAN